MRKSHVLGLSFMSDLGSLPSAFGFSFLGKRLRSLSSFLTASLSCRVKIILSESSLAKALDRCFFSPHHDTNVALRLTCIAFLLFSRTLFEKASPLPHRWQGSMQSHGMFICRD